MKKITSVALILVFILSSFHSVLARRKADWNTLKNLQNQEIAIKIKDNKTIFGILRSFNDSELQLQIADKKKINPSTTTIARTDIGKIWTAELRYGGRQIGKGALIGAGAGATVGTAIFLGTKADDDDGLAGANIILGLVYGAGIGAVAGVFNKKSHKKKNLIYSI